MPTDSFTHRPVMVQELLDVLRPQPSGRYIDCTFGRGGHTRALLQRMGAGGKVLALDKDPEAIAAGAVLAAADSRLTLVHAAFRDLAGIVHREGLQGRANGVIFDLGVSSPQLDDPGRGFSFQEDGPLDMRMDPGAGISAATWLARVTERELSEVLRVYGEERYARRIARAVVAARAGGGIETTRQLADLAARASPSRERSKHPATRTFLAVRIAVNAELEELEAGLEGAAAALAETGRIAVICFHSLEHRVVKRFFRASLRLRAVGKPLYADPAEVRDNPRARSAALRVAERVA